MSAEDTGSLGRRLRGFPDREPSLDANASSAHGLPLESLDKVRSSQRWDHAGEWFTPQQIQVIPGEGQPLDPDLAGRLGLDAEQRDGWPHVAATLDSPHAHRVDCFSEVGHTAMELFLSRDGFAGWAGPDPVRSLTGSGSSGTPTSHGARQFVTGPWSLLPRLILSWAGVAPAWAGWPPLRVPARLIEDRLSGDRLHTGGTADVAEELGHWWLVRLSGIGPGAEPWLISERRGCMVVTGDSSSEDVTLVQVNSLSMLTAVVSYWDAALAVLATEGR